MKELDAAKTPEKRFYALNDAGKQILLTGKVEDAQKYAKELMTLLPNFQNNWNYGNAVQDANLMMFRGHPNPRAALAATKLFTGGPAGDSWRPTAPPMNHFGLPILGR